MAFDNYERKKRVFAQKCEQSEHLEKCPIYSPLTPDQAPFKGGRYLNERGHRDSPRAHRSEGFPRTGLFHPWARWDRDLAHFQSCSRIGACAFLQIPRFSVIYEDVLM